MATITATKAGNWSDTSVWDLARVPASGDDVALASYTVVWDAAQATIPATGNLASISATTTGQITIDLSDAAFHGGAALNVSGNITAGDTAPTNRGVIYVSGTTNHVLTITAANIIGGSGANCYALRHTSTGTVNVTADIQNGSTTSTYGVYCDNGGILNITGNLTVPNAGTYAANFYTGTVSISGNITAGASTCVINSYATVSLSGIITGGTESQAWGYWNNGGGDTTLSATTRLVYGTKGAAYTGEAPAWSPASTSYAKFYVGASFGQAANTEFPQVLAAANIKAGVTSGSVTGTLSGGGNLVGTSVLVS